MLQCTVIVLQFCGSVWQGALQCVAAPRIERETCALIMLMVCVSVCNTKCCINDDTTTKEPYISAKEPYISAKEPYILAKEPYISAKGPAFSQNVAAMMTLQHTATHCNALQHTAIHCNTLQHTATQNVAAMMTLQSDEDS